MRGRGESERQIQVDKEEEKSGSRLFLRGKWDHDTSSLTPSSCFKQKTSEQWSWFLTLVETKINLQMSKDHFYCFSYRPSINERETTSNICSFHALYHRLIYFCSDSETSVWKYLCDFIYLTLGGSNGLIVTSFLQFRYSRRKTSESITLTSVPPAHKDVNNVHLAHLVVELVRN